MHRIIEIAEIARHEVIILIRTRRILMIAAVYLGFALLGGMGYTVATRFIEQGAIDAFASQGVSRDMAIAQVALYSNPAYQKLASFFAGVDTEEMADVLQHSPVLPVFLWGSLVFLPFVILLTSFDQSTTDLGARTLCYSTLRVPRAALVLGKALAHTVTFVVLTFVSALILLVLGAIFLDSIDVTQQVWGFIRVWLCLLPFGACYIGVASFASVNNTQPMASLLSAIGITVGLRALGGLAQIPEAHPLASMRLLHWLSPAAHHEGFWRAGLMAPLGSVLAYSMFAVVFLMAAIFRLRTRDL